MKTKKISKLVKKQRRNKRAVNRLNAWRTVMWNDDKTLLAYFMGE